MLVVVSVGVLVLVVHHPGVVPDHGPPWEHTVGVGHHCGHVEDKSSSLLIIQEPDVTLVYLTVLGAGVHSIHHDIFPLLVIKLLLKNPA